MMRVRVKADGRIVEVLPDGRERALPATARPVETLAAGTGEALLSQADPAAYARQLRARTRCTQAEFAHRIGVPIETVRNWEQGKRAPRGPARALLKVIECAPDIAFKILSAPVAKS